MSLKSACEAFGISRSGQYRKENQRQDSNRDEVLVGGLKELRLLHPFWGYRRMTAWLSHREGVWVNRRRVYRLMRENGLVVKKEGTGHYVVFRGGNRRQAGLTGTGEST